jgi:hypothetical protein
MLRSHRVSLAVGVAVGVLLTGGALLAQKQPAAPSVEGQPFEIVDTVGSTFVLNKATGQIWRLSFTDVGGNKYWYGMYAPMEPPSSFEEFRARVRRELSER